MSRAREEFLIRLRSFSETLGQRYILDSQPAPHADNSQARLLRNGLAVMGFTILEDFIRRRVGEATTFLAATDVDFDDLPSRLRRALTHGATRATLQIEQTAFEEIEDKIKFIHEQTKVIGSGDLNVRAFSEYAFGWEASNLNANDVSYALNAFGVDGAWTQIALFMKRTGFGVPDPESEFKNAAQRRHRAAHNATANTQPTDLESFSFAATGIALAIDALLSESIRRFKQKDNDIIQQTKKVTSQDVAIRYLTRQKDKKWTEKKEKAMRAAKIYPDYDNALRNAQERANRNYELLLILNESMQLQGWITHEQ